MSHDFWSREREKAKIKNKSIEVEMPEKKQSRRQFNNQAPPTEQRSKAVSQRRQIQEQIDVHSLHTATFE